MDPVSFREYGDHIYKTVPTANAWPSNDGVSNLMTASRKRFRKEYGEKGNQGKRRTLRKKEANPNYEKDARRTRESEIDTGKSERRDVKDPGKDQGGTGSSETSGGKDKEKGANGRESTQRRVEKDAGNFEDRNKSSERRADKNTRTLKNGEGS